MNARSVKNKGLRFENYLVQILKSQLDQKTYRVESSGSGLAKNDLRCPNFNLEIEAKNANSIHLVDDWEQTKRQNTSGNLSVLAIRNPKKPEFQEILIVMDIGDFIELVKNNKGEAVIESNFSPNLKWKLQRARQVMQEVIKELEN